ncbi:MAG TPA: class I SAM-dependent methyltransferase, partial [Patescibacteria group bacterium]|nr:class I SAM-dependent methyltransferase [Patescibacteria group bacterium]
ILNGTRNPLLLVGGCGTGKEVAILRARFPKARVIGFDASSGMIGEAKARVPQGEFYVHDIRENWADLLDEKGIDGEIVAVSVNSAMTHIKKSEVNEVMSGVREVMDTKDGLFYFGLKSSKDGAIFSDVRLGGMTRYFTTYSTMEVQLVKFLASYNGFHSLTELNLPNIYQDRPDWWEGFFTS